MCVFLRKTDEKTTKNRAKIDQKSSTIGHNLKNKLSKAPTTKIDPDLSPNSSKITPESTKIEPIDL